MTLALREITAELYAARVLPLTHELWGYGRSLDAYRARTQELAFSEYGKRAYRTVGLWDGDRELVASFKRYERTARLGAQPLRAMGVGAVYTASEFRGRGYASAMLGLALDEARAKGFDFAFLFSDIHPLFYKEIGFAELPSRSISLRADSLQAARLSAQTAGLRDWSGIRSCYDATISAQRCAFTRPAYFWSWIRALLTPDLAGAQRVNLVLRRAGSIEAYVFGRREPKHDAYIVDEFGYAGEGAARAIPALLRFAAGDLRRVTGWLPPLPARNLLPRGSVRKRSDAVFMIAPLSAGGKAFLECAQTKSAADPVWSTDHI